MLSMEKKSNKQLFYVFCKIWSDLMRLHYTSIKSDGFQYYFSRKLRD
jgi:hypothetical protein